MAFQNIASPAPGQGGADRGAPRDAYHPSRSRGWSAPRPYAALPHDIAGDSRLSPLDKTVLLALLYFARSKDHCWPADSSIAARVARSVATVQRSLRDLEKVGLVIRVRTDANHTGRIIRIAWRMRTDARPLPAPVSDPPRASVTDEGIVIVKGEAEKEPVHSAPERRRPEEAPPAATPPSPPPIASTASSMPVPSPVTAAVSPSSPPVPPPDAATAVSASSPSVPPIVPVPAAVAAPSPGLSGLTPAEQARLAELSDQTRERVLTFLATGAPILVRDAKRLLRPLAPPEPPPESIPLADLLAGLPGRLDRVAVASGRLCRELKDHRSFGYYRSVAEAVARREHPVEALLMACREGLNPQSHRPGAVFASVWKREQSLQARC